MEDKQEKDDQYCSFCLGTRTEIVINFSDGAAVDRRERPCSFCCKEDSDEEGDR